MEEIINRIYSDANLLKKKINEIVNNSDNKFVYTSDTHEKDAIFGIFLFGDEFVEEKIHALRINNGVLEAYVDVFGGYSTITKEEMENDQRWYWIDASGDMYFLQTIVSIAESIEQYI